jgi:acetylglutamate/LysW-gamma-L-alpha-aminoadipate kinase
MGLSGIDGKVVKGKRNRGIKILENGKRKIVRDYSGKPQSINTELITVLLKNGYTPVLTVPIIDENNFAINSENDDILNILQKSIQADKIIQLIEAPGLLENPENQDSLVSQLTCNKLESWEQRVEGRMKRKLYALRKLFESGTKAVFIGDGRIENPISNVLQGKGTIIQ